jgi:hypothetical protein
MIVEEVVKKKVITFQWFQVLPIFNSKWEDLNIKKKKIMDMSATLMRNQMTKKNFIKMMIIAFNHKLMMLV